MTASHSARFAANYALLHALHGIGDQWLQTGHQAVFKGARGPCGQKACAGHVATYTAVSALGSLAASKFLGQRIHWPSWLAGQAITAITHYVIDRRVPLRKLATALGKEDYLTGSTVVRKPGGKAELGGPGTALMELDQSLHKLLLAVTALVASSRGE